MVNWKSIIILLLILIAGIWGVFYLFPSEEKKIKKQFTLLGQLASREADENPLAMAQKVRKIGGLFAEKCRLKVPGYSLSGVYNRQEIIALAARGRLHFSQLTLKFYDLNITFPEEREAKVSLTGRLIGKAQGRETVDETRELACALKRIDQEWAISELEVVEVLKK